MTAVVAGSLYGLVAGSLIAFVAGSLSDRLSKEVVVVVILTAVVAGSLFDRLSKMSCYYHLDYLYSRLTHAVMSLSAQSLVI